ncbi:hypothetical protein CEK26_003662 [Fusarium fujikuroi]|nr:hypothetical protein CEK27_003654 [Fusarium fujikuroi]QGJ02218.1 hypothetical protein CEK26_003662 [Fusarium fujikuroi]
MSGDAAQDVTDVKAEDENDTNPTIVPRDADDDINKKNALATAGTRNQGCSIHRPALRWQDAIIPSRRELKKQEEAERGHFTRWRTNPDDIDDLTIPAFQLTEASDSAQSFDTIHATVIEPNKEAIDRLLVEYNKSVHILDQRNDVQFFEKYHKQYTSGYLDEFGRPRTKFNLRPDKSVRHAYRLPLQSPASKEATHDCEAQNCPRLYAACFIAWHGPSFRYFFSKAAEADENPSGVFFSMPRNARISVKSWEDRVQDVARDTMRETVRENNWNWAAVLASAVLKRGFTPSEYDLGGFVN